MAAGVFKIAWWLAIAWLISAIVRTVLVFKRRAVETRFLQDLCAGMMYGGAILGIIANAFDMALNGLLAASGVIAIVLGLALQSTLSDLFSGVVLNMSKPYHPGDWVILDGGLEGRVIETNWRATQLLTASNDIAIVPNNLVAKARLVNASNPTGAYGLTVTVKLGPTVAPASGVAVLQTAMLGCNRILRSPPATVMVRSLDALALECQLAFFVPAIEQGLGARNEVFDLVYRHCAAASLRFAPPAGAGFALPPPGARPNISTIPQRTLEQLSIFASLSEHQRLILAPKMTRRTFKAGEVLVEQGAVARALFVLTSGVLAALQHNDGKMLEVLRVAPGACFGQAGLLTGATTTFKVEALTRVVVYEIATDDIAPILKERPPIAAELSQIMIKREAAGTARRAELKTEELPVDSLPLRIVRRLKGLLGFVP